MDMVGDLLHHLAMHRSGRRRATAPVQLLQHREHGLAAFVLERVTPLPAQRAGVFLVVGLPILGEFVQMLGRMEGAARKKGEEAQKQLQHARA
jgi:hypothetical protein